MSRIAKWKIDKTKVKVVFRLQFHATHVSGVSACFSIYFCWLVDLRH